MPRRPLFCRTCADFLDQLTRAAEAASAAGKRMIQAVGTRDFVAAMRARTEKIKSYEETGERFQRHRELVHGFSDAGKIPEAQRGTSAREKSIPDDRC